MRSITTFRFLLLVTLALTLTNCANKSNNVSGTTGWTINDKEGGFQYNTGFQEQETGPGLVFIEGVLLLEVKYKMIQCMIGITRLLNNTFSHSTWMKLKQQTKHT